LEILFVSEVMRTSVLALSENNTVSQTRQALHTTPHQEQRLLPVVNADGELMGILTRQDIRNAREGESNAGPEKTLGDLARKNAVHAHPDEPLRIVVNRMAEQGLTRLPVVDRHTRKLLGLVSLNDLLKARTRNLDEERRRERTLKLRFFSASRGRTPEFEVE
jgi:CBS domain-containing protein